MANVGWCAPQPPTPHPSDEQTLAPSGAGVFFFAQTIENARLRGETAEAGAIGVRGREPGCGAGLAWRRGWRTFLTGETRRFPLKAPYHNIVITRVQRSAAPIDALTAATARP
jgi:hypothetical protein